MFQTSAAANAGDGLTLRHTAGRASGVRSPFPNVAVGATAVVLILSVFAASAAFLSRTPAAVAQAGPPSEATGDVNCDNILSIADAVLIAQFTVGNRSSAESCQVRDATSVVAAAGDVNSDGGLSIADAVLIAQCVVGIDHGFCTEGAPPLGPAENLAMILANETRNTVFDSNSFRGVPMAAIEVADLTEPGDLYNETLLDTSISAYFRVRCEFSHFAYDDPIIFPNEPGRAHLHMFFGNTETTAYSTFDSLLNTGTGSCNGEDLNRTAYWVPALLDSSGNALIPYEIMVYYKNDNFLLDGANELVNPFPDNLRMVVGNAMADSAQTELSGGSGSQPIVQFACGPAYESSYQPLIPDCIGTGAGTFGPDGRALEMQISFPQCYNPDLGTYVQGGAHVSYSQGGYYGSTCPDSHPYDISSIMYRIFFSPDDYGGALTDLHVSSDVRPTGEIRPGGTTVHADWFGAWHPATMDLWVQNCNNIQADCEIGLLGRDPLISLVPRIENGVGPGYLAPAAQLAELCPSKAFDATDPLRSVALCLTG